MPRGSKKRRNAAKKNQENRPPSSVRSPGNETQIDEKQSEVVRVESATTFEEEDPTEKSDNGGGSTGGRSGNCSDDDLLISKNSLPDEGISSVEEVVAVSSVSEKVPLLVERVIRESLVGDNRESPNQPLRVLEDKRSWRSCCGLFELFSGSGR